MAPKFERGKVAEAGDDCKRAGNSPKNPNDETRKSERMTKPE
jgi:hypothetical protein